MTIAPAASLKAILGPTNTGKTFFAIERMLAHRSGMIGLPLRLLAREVYHKVADRVGASQVALVTGEERIVPPKARFWVCTVEAMPLDIKVECLAIDEIQVATDFDRGHVFRALDLFRFQPDAFANPGEIDELHASSVSRWRIPARK